MPFSLITINTDMIHVSVSTAIRDSVAIYNPRIPSSFSKQHVIYIWIILNSAIPFYLSSILRPTRF